MIRLTIAFACLLFASCSTTITPLCRHIVKAQHAACVDAGYKTRTCLNENPKQLVGGWKYHTYVQIQVNGRWESLPQPETHWTASPTAPPGKLIKIVRITEANRK